VSQPHLRYFNRFLNKFLALMMRYMMLGIHNEVGSVLGGRGRLWPITPRASRLTG